MCRRPAEHQLCAGAGSIETNHRWVGCFRLCEGRGVRDLCDGTVLTAFDVQAACTALGVCEGWVWGRARSSAVSAGQRHTLLVPDVHAPWPSKRTH